jgi:hypothetical protein
MMSALECLHKAELCEEQARVCDDRDDKRMLLATAAQWRTLAKAAERLENGRRSENSG